jgi:hypothetical protein
MAAGACEVLAGIKTVADMVVTFRDEEAVAGFWKRWSGRGAAIVRRAATRPSKTWGW